MPDHERVAYELLKSFGAFITESSKHLAKYVPCFIMAVRDDMIERSTIPLDEYLYLSQADLTCSGVH